MNGFVLDASVAAKWVLPAEQEPHVDRAESILCGFTDDTVKLVVPDLFWPEIGNILWKACRLGRISPGVAEKAMATLSGLSIPTYPVRGLLADALRMALRYNRTIYDCVYVALAIESNCTFLTADERLANAVAAYFPVRWLGVV